MAKFKSQDLRDMLWGDSDSLKLVQDEITGTSRWATENTVVFEHDGHLFVSGYRGSVGDNEGDYWDYEDEVECDEVFPVEKSVTVYMTQKEIDANG
jgi:hypothetical protein